MPLVRRWDTVLGGGTLTSFDGTSLIIRWYKAAPVVTWEESYPQTEAWYVLCTMCLVDVVEHPATFEMVPLVKEMASTSN